MSKVSTLRCCSHRRWRIPTSCLKITTAAATNFRSYHEVSFSATGDPANVLQYRTHNGLPPHPDSRGDSSLLCRVDMLHAPWNPADGFAVQGRYGSPYTDRDANRDALQHSSLFPENTVAGAEGLGRVVELFNSTDQNGNENQLQVGDWVTVGKPGLGTMRSSMWVPAHSMVRLERGEELFERAGYQACTLFQLGGTAIRMLRDFVALQPGEVVLQNAGNSAVGYMVSQLAQLRLGVSVVSLARKGSKTKDQWNEMVDHLMNSGKCSLVVAEEDLQDRQGLAALQSQLEELGNGHRPRLALNAVGGTSASHLLSCLAQGGTMVTYGGMSLQPVKTGTAHFIFKDLRLFGYWHGRWMAEHSYTERHDMVNELVQSLLEQELKCPPVQVFPLSQVQQGLEWESTQQSNVAIRYKLVWDCREK